MSLLEAKAFKKLRSFALFPARKRAKYESASSLFHEAALEYLTMGNYERAGECLRAKARIYQNKLSQPEHAAAYYMSATRAFMMASESLDSAFECLQLAVASRTRPNVKHKEGNDALSVRGITVMEGEPVVRRFSDAGNGSESARPAINFESLSGGVTLHSTSSVPATPGGLSTPPRRGTATPSSVTNSFGLQAASRSPALTAQAGTITIDGRGLKLSPETMAAPISSGTTTAATRSASIQSRPNSAHTSSTVNAHSSTIISTINSSNHASSSSSSSFSSSSSSSSHPPLRQRRHSLSGCANSSHITADGGVVHEVLHIDLLLARLAVQLATDLWTDLDFRDAILALEIASSLFATLLIAERNQGLSFRRRRSQLFTNLKSPKSSKPTKSSVPTVPPVLTHDLPLIRSESAAVSSSPTTPVMQARAPPSNMQHAKDMSALPIEERLAGLLGPNAYAISSSSQTLGANLTLSSQPLRTKPIPSLVSSNTDESRATSARALVLHEADPLLSVSEGESTLYGQAEECATTILEESLLCRFQLANYYITYDEERDVDDRHLIENQELRRSKALFEQVASHKPDEALVHATIDPLIFTHLQGTLVPGVTTPAQVDDITTLISQYAADDGKLHHCLFLSGLCDALIGIRVYQASQARPTHQSQTTIAVTQASVASSMKNDKKLKSPVLPPPALAPPPVPDLYLNPRPVFCPPILLRYRALCPSFGNTCEIRLLRSCNGLLQIAANLSHRLDEAFGGNSRMTTSHQAAKQLFQQAWGAEIVREFTCVVQVYTQQAQLTNVVAKLLVSIKKEMKQTITMK